jgi:hypothetical protein
VKIAFFQYFWLLGWDSIDPLPQFMIGRPTDDQRNSITNNALKVALNLPQDQVVMPPDFSVLDARVFLTLEPEPFPD